MMNQTSLTALMILTTHTLTNNIMRIFFDIDCGETVSPEDIKDLLNKTADFLSSDLNHTVQNVPDQGILDVQFH